MTGTSTKERKSAKESSCTPNSVERLYLLAIFPSKISKAPPSHAKSAARKKLLCVMKNMAKLPKVMLPNVKRLARLK